MKIAPQHRLYACFFLFALTTGALMARLPDIQTHLGVTESQLGLTMIGMSIGSLISLTFGASVIERLGVRTTALFTVLGPALLFATIPWLGVAPAVFAVLLLVGLLAGALEINLNVEIDRLEAQIGRGIMNRAHGFWSLGFFVTALVASVVRQADISMQLHLGVTFVVVAVIGCLVIAGIRNAPARALSDDAKAPLVALPTLGLLPLCLIGIAALLVEGAGIDWSAIYMRDIFSVEPFIGGLGLTLFTFFMAMARLFVDPVVDRFGARAVAVSLLVLSAMGLVAVWLAPHPYVALLGFAAMGAGCSAVYPLTVSAAAQRTDRPAHVNVAALGQVSFIIFFLAPPLLGFVGEHLGMRTAYFVCLPVVVIALLCIRSLATRRLPAPTGGAQIHPHHG